MSSENEDIRSLLMEYRKENQRQAFRARFAVIGLVAFLFAFGLFFVSAMNRINHNTDLISQAQESLKVTCREATSISDALPANVQKDCDKAENNQFVEQVQPLPAVNDPDPDDPDPNDPEIQDPEIQDSELQDPELTDTETQEEEVQDPEIQEDEVQEDEIQDPEIDDAPIPGPKGDKGDPGPNCAPGYSLQERFVEGNPMTTEDDETWLICVRDN